MVIFDSANGTENSRTGNVRRDLIDAFGVECSADCPCAVVVDSL